MKRCPICNTDYLDDTLEFCLEDGSRLLKPPPLQETNRPTEPAVPYLNPGQAETVRLQMPNEIETAADIKKPTAGLLEKKETAKKNIAETSMKILETAPIVFALAHNYWQWLYLSRQPAYDLTAFLTSYSFLIWMFLLCGGLLFGLFSLKYGSKKGFAVTALVVLAINVILSIVPK